MITADQIFPLGPECLAQYAEIPIRFTSDRILRVDLIDGGLGGMRLVETALNVPQEKDYDLFESPLDWPKTFEMANFQFWIGYDANQAVGGAALVWDTPAVNMLDGRKDLAVLWDLRVHPNYRGQGIGRALFTQAAQYARQLGLAQMKIETQNNNVSANRFYQAMGCHLGAIHRYAYAGTPGIEDEVMLLWYLAL